MYEPAPHHALVERLKTMQDVLGDFNDAGVQVQQLEDAVDDAIRENSTVVLKKPFFRKSFDEWGNLNVEIIPPPSPPQKNAAPPPRLYNPRKQEI